VRPKLNIPALNSNHWVLGSCAWPNPRGLTLERATVPWLKAFTHAEVH